MNKKLIYFLMLLTAVFTACSDDDNDNPSDGDRVKVTLQSEYQTTSFKVVKVSPTIENQNLNYKWILTKNPVDNVTDSLLSTTKDLEFIAVYSGDYELKLEVTDGNNIGSQTTIIKVSDENERAKYDPFITKIYDFEPAPGTLANDLYLENGYTKEDMMKIALGRIDSTSVGYQLDLGSFGGSIVVGFDHTVPNILGQKDFRIYGTNEIKSATPIAPGLIFVAYDKNRNSKPDDDEWFEIKGSAHDSNMVTNNFTITYHRPAPDKAPVQIGSNDWFYDRESVLCKNNDGESFYMAVGKLNKELCPRWNKSDVFSYAGRRIKINIKSSHTGQYTLFSYDMLDWGYANAIDPDIDIDWAIDKDGNKVHLPGIDFIKVVNCVSVNETMIYSHYQTSMTTRFAGVADLHYLEKYKLKHLKQ